MRQHAVDIFHAAVNAVQPQHLLPEYIRFENEHLYLGDRSFLPGSIHKIYVIGAGKASAAMALETEKILGNRIKTGIVVTKYDHSLPLQHIKCIEAGHPVPDTNSSKGGVEIVQLLESTGEKDIVIALISGGASSLIVDHPPGTSLVDLQNTFNHLLKSGATIHEINTVRKHLSPQIKGGQLARAAHPATLVSFIISDVIGDALDSIGSGPTVPDSSTFADARAILDKYKLMLKVAPAIKRYIEKGMNKEIPDTPEINDPIFSKTYNYLIGSNKIALEAAAQKATDLGYHVQVLTDSLQGEAREQALQFVQRLQSYHALKPACLLMGGETTVTIKRNGKGGRNQEFVLSAITALRQNNGDIPVILSAGTDGTDGPTDAAGAVVDKELLERIDQLPIDPQQYLNNNDSYNFFKQCGGHIITGPTQTNVMDIVIGLLY